ncbi:hypothetical protein GCM10011594_18650 [Nakamurella endophytica]|uniref:Uncharacterized protein n=1 Tax=Nakamurella endophytica TaxID=1748367 RepID=A0A917SW84_9ACTN|nr:hypothetical protein GCM10011594_18650 [Nakamurella endophytica]
MRFGDTCGSAAGRIRSLDAGEFVGDEAELYAQRMSGDLPPCLVATSDAWHLVGGVLTTYADDLESVQRRLTTLSAQAGDREASVRCAQDDVAAGRAADRAHAEAAASQPAGTRVPADDGYRSSTPVAEQALDRAHRALQETVDAVTALRAEHDAAVQRCVDAVERARASRFADPPGFWTRVGRSITSWVGDHADALLEISSVLKEVASVAAMLSFVPGMAAVAVAAGGVAVAVDATVKITTGEGSWTEIALDAVGVVPGGRTAGAALRGLRREAGEVAAVGRTARGAVPAGWTGAERITGGRIIRPGDPTKVPGWAEASYDEIRATSDTALIASNTRSVVLPDGHRLDEGDLEQIKRHLFTDEHVLEYGDGAVVLGRFDADPDIAEAWYRLRAGSPADSDLVLLHHELYESSWLRDHPGSTYVDAHARANGVADWHAIIKSRHRRGGNPWRS